jgi:hypothetical protein
MIAKRSFSSTWEISFKTGLDKLEVFAPLGLKVDFERPSYRTGGKQDAVSRREN